MSQVWMHARWAATNLKMPEPAMAKLIRPNALVEEHGELLTGEPLRKCLGYRSDRGFRRSVSAGSCPVPVFKIPGRKGWFARTRAIQEWIEGLP